MTFGSAIYKLLLGPLELLFETIYTLAYNILGHPGIAIIFLSLAMNFLVLPLYRRADAMQAEERDLEASMMPWVDHIKKTFTGDERFMMLQTYYRQRGYAPVQALKGSLSLLLEIPFFIAAYRFLSGLALLQGVSFGPIRDLGAPDGLISVAGMTVNLLPILMTLINAVSAAIYLKGFPLKSKLQMYGIALIFLVFLYGSPAGLVFYWTLNNVFSLLKNLFYKIKNPGKVLAICASVAGWVLLALMLALYEFDSVLYEAFAILVLLLLQAPVLLLLLKKKGKLPARKLPEATKTDDRLFLLCCVFLALLTGVLIPSAVISDAPFEFVDPAAYHSPLLYILSSALIAVGTFVLWFGIFYRLADGRARKLISTGMWALSGAAVVDYLFFGTNYGNLSSLLIYDVRPQNGIGANLLNLLVLAVVIAVFWLIIRKKISFVRTACFALIFAALTMSVINMVTIRRELDVDQAVLEAETTEELPTLPLSRNGKNVVVIMMDRSCGYFIPFIMEEIPGLEEQFSGFTFYPNTLSFASTTNVALPAVFGGYEYTPTASNSRSDVSLADKHNEALHLMPVLFSEAGYEVTVCDPSYAGYRDTMDLSAFDDYPAINACYLRGLFTTEYDADMTESTEASRHRNFFCYSIFKCSPLILQPVLYWDGYYNDANAIAAASATQAVEGISGATGLNQRFLKNYAVLCNLENISEVRDDGENTFLMMCNELTHAPMLLQKPDYVPSAAVDNVEYDAAHAVRTDAEGREMVITSELQVTHYDANVAALIKLGEWFDYLRENGVYDNTRIIIVADHGYPFGFEDLSFGSESWTTVTAFNPTLMVKDFDSEGYTVDHQFMTNADVPVLALQDLIADPVNPATGVPITDDAKHDPVHEVQAVLTWQVTKNNGNTFLPGHWAALHGEDIYALDQWELLGTY